jgi:hypothetical protein
MSTFRQDMEVVLDGEVFKCQTRAVDHTAAEVLTAKDGGTIETRPVSHGFRIAFAAFRRCHPENDLSRSFGRFLEVLDEIRQEGAPTDDEGVELEPDALDPTHMADGAAWP